MKQRVRATCAEQLRLLGDPTRLEILSQLVEGPRHVKDLHKALPIDQSLLSHHLKLMREAGIVNSRRDGKAVLYSIAPEILAAGDGKTLNFGCCSFSFQ